MYVFEYRMWVLEFKSVARFVSDLIQHGITAESVSPDVGTPKIEIAHAPDTKHWREMGC